VALVDGEVSAAGMIQAWLVGFHPPWDAPFGQSKQGLSERSGTNKVNVSLAREDEMIQAADWDGVG
jgi:hypothetical protein